ncbi:MAG: hypothetical protein N3A54_07030 [Patescibacteria group bacterium]|nr:hypothetical protein [Patescibacteria group bacterium]
MVLMVGGLLSAIFAFGNTDQKKILRAIGISGIMMIVVLRYTRTPLFSSYLVFLHPFIFFLTGVFIFRLFRLSRLIGIVSLIIVVLFSIRKSFQEIQHGTNHAAQQGNSWSTFLFNKYPETTFSVYVPNFDNTIKTSAVVLSLYLDAAGRAVEGRQIGVVRYPFIGRELKGTFLLIDDEKAIVDLSDQTHDQLLSS